MPNVVYNFSTLPAEVQKILAETPEVFIEGMTEGMPWIREHFTIIENDGLTPLWSIELLDFLRPAGDDFLPENAIKFGAKIPTFQNIDGDLEYPRSQLIELTKTHIKNIAKGPGLKDAVQNKPFAYMFIDQLVKKAGSLIEENALFKGVRSNAVGAKGSGLSMDGLIVKMDAGIASGDIPEEHVYEPSGAFATDEDVYNEVKEICQLTVDTRADGKPLNLYLSSTMRRRYNIGRRAALAPLQISPAEKPDTVDDFDNVRFVTCPGLIQSQRMFASRKENLYFCTPEGFFNPAITMIEDIKKWKANMMFSGTVEYNFGKLMFTNDRN